MKNLSVPLFRLAGSIRLKADQSQASGMVRLAIHDTADAHPGDDIIVSIPAEQAQNIKKAVEAFNNALEAK